MKLLLDTHIFLWFISGNERLSQKYFQEISNLDNEVFVSVISIWECTIKYQLGKLPLPKSPEIYLPQQRKRHYFDSLTIDENTIAQLVKLPSLHRDPFDRLLMCQALEHDLVMLTEDKAVLAYSMINFLS